jgi:hypothetical protein
MGKARVNISSSFESKVALVTEAASGIGLTVATIVAEWGAKVCLVDIERNPIEIAETILFLTPMRPHISMVIIW